MAKKHNNKSHTIHKEHSFPPPIRKPKRRLILQPWLQGQGGSINRPLIPDTKQVTETPELTRLRELEVHLDYRQDKLLKREDELGKWSKKLAEQQRELQEQEALLLARRHTHQGTEVARGNGSSAQDDQDLQRLKTELEAQQEKIEEAKRNLKEREAYIEKCENDLVEKSMLLTERETWIEQNEEDLNNMSHNPFNGLNQDDTELEQSA